MKTVYVEFEQRGQAVLRTGEVPPEGLAPLEVLVRNEASVISPGTELACLNGQEVGVTFPFRPGYGSVGRVEAKGAAVVDFNVGDRVFYTGRHASLQRYMHGADHPYGRLYPAPEDIDPVEAAIACMAQIALTAPNITALDLGDTVAVFGLGMIGNLAAQLYALRGARVIAVDPEPARCRVASQIGFAQVLDCPSQEQVAEIKKLTGGRGAHVTCDAAGHATVVLNCVSATADFGQVVLLGSPRSSVTANIAPMLFDIHCRGLVIRGAHTWRFPATDGRGLKPTVPGNLRTVFDLIQSGRLKTRPLLSHVIRPQAAPDAYQGLQSRPGEYLGVVIDWRGV